MIFFFLVWYRREDLRSIWRGSMHLSIGCLINLAVHLYVALALFFSSAFCIQIVLMCINISVFRLPSHHLDPINPGNVCLWFLYCETSWSMLSLIVRFNLSWCNVMSLLMGRSGQTRPIQLVSWVCMLLSFYKQTYTWTLIIFFGSRRLSNVNQFLN